MNDKYGEGWLEFFVVCCYDSPVNNFLSTLQVTTINRIELLPDPNEAAVNEAGRKLGIQPVGWIFTDLVADDLAKGTVKNFRGNIVSQDFHPLYHLLITSEELLF